MYRYLLLISLFVFLFFSVGRTNGSADPLKGEAGADNQPGKSKKSEENFKARKRVLHMKEIEIFGNVEKPKAMFIIPRTPHQYSSNEYKRDFSEEILKPITKQGVADRKEWQEAVTGP